MFNIYNFQKLYIAKVIQKPSEKKRKTVQDNGEFEIAESKDGNTWEREVGFGSS